MKFYCMCLRTMKLWLKWFWKAEVLQWDTFPELIELLLIGCLIELIWTPESKSNTSTPKTNSQTSWQREITHAMNGIICWPCLISAILALMPASQRWRNEFNKIQEKRVTAKSRPMMNLTARMPSFVSSSASSNPGRTSYGHWTWTTCSWRQRRETCCEAKIKLCSGIWFISVFSSVEKWMWRARSIRETWAKFLGFTGKSWSSSWRTSSRQNRAFCKERRNCSRWIGETWDSESPRTGLFWKFRHGQWRSRICEQSQEPSANSRLIVTSLQCQCLSWLIIERGNLWKPKPTKSQKPIKKRPR